VAPPAHGSKILTDVILAAHGSEISMDVTPPAHGSEIPTDVTFAAHGSEISMDVTPPAHGSEISMDVTLAARNSQVTQACDVTGILSTISTPSCPDYTLVIDNIDMNIRRSFQ